MGLFSRCRRVPRYRDRGITVCERWYIFENFLADMGEAPPGLTIERENNDGPYSPSNCCWATRATQSENTCQTIKVVVNGETMSLTRACKILGKNYSTVYSKFYRGATIEEAMA